MSAERRCNREDLWRTLSILDRVIEMILEGVNAIADLSNMFVDAVYVFVHFMGSRIELERC